MWREGTIEIPNSEGQKVPVYCWVKSFDEPSEWGLEEGRISKLMLKQDGKVVYNFDRGEDIAPQTPEAEAALAILMEKYN